MCKEGLRTAKPALCLTSLGAGFHQLQDFYAHSNWVEPRFGTLPGYDGPGWAGQGRGITPTWFDLPVAVRDPAKSRAYTNGNGKPIDYKDRLWNRGHGHWKSDSNKQLGTRMNKDWPGRPRYLEAYMASYFATRQWVEAVRRAVDNGPYWSQVRSWQPQSAKERNELSRDLRKGARAVSYWAGHWQGQGEPTGGEAPGPGGSLDDIFFASRDYFSSGRSSFRSEFERVVRLLAVKSDNPPTYVVPSTRQMQELTRFVVVKVLRMKGRGAGDPLFDEADFYAQGLIAGQHYLSAFIHGYDGYSFKRPNYPFTFVKAVTLAPRLQSLTDLAIEVKTSGTSGAGTDDNVYLRVNDRLRFKLDRNNVDDFERNQKAVYTLPVDTSTPFDKSPSGYTLRDIQYLQLEKSKDGSSGAWKLGAVRLFVNGRVGLWQRLHRAVAPRRQSNVAPDRLPATARQRGDDPGLALALRRRQLPLRRRRPRRSPPRLPAPQRRDHLPAGDGRRADDRWRLRMGRQPLQLRQRQGGDPLSHRDDRVGSACSSSPAASAASSAATATASPSAPAGAAASATAPAHLPRPRHLRPRHHDVHGREPGHRSGRTVQRARDGVPARGDQRAGGRRVGDALSTRRDVWEACARRGRTT